MKRTLNKTLAFFLFFSLFNVSLLLAEENICYLIPPENRDIWVIVYSESRDGDRGDVIWEGKIPVNGKKQIKCDNGHIRYEYAMEQNQPYEGDLSRWCNGNNEIKLP
jgi:hypothetical protein